MGKCGGFERKKMLNIYCFVDKLNFTEMHKILDIAKLSLIFFLSRPGVYFNFAHLPV